MPGDRRARTARTAGVLLAFAVLAACASRSSEPLERARATAREVRTDPAVSAYAPQPLSEVERTLGLVEAAWEEGEPSEALEHLAYVIEQRAAIARAVAAERQALEKMARLREERERLLVRANQREIDRARLRAQEAEAEAREAETRSRRLQEQARALEQQTRALEQETRSLEDALADLRARETERGFAVSLGDQVLFEIESAELNAGGREALGPVVDALLEHPDRSIVVEGHTDSIGEEGYNLDLSQRRADAVADFLIEQGVEPGRIVAHGYGEQHPIASNDTPAGRAQNRRVDIVILESGEAPPSAGDLESGEAPPSAGVE